MKGPAYRIKTERLLIRCLEPKDAFTLKQAIDESIDHLRKFLPWTKNEPETVEQKIARNRLRRADFDSDNKYEYGIFLNDESKLIGMIALMKRVGDGALEIGYWIHKDYTKKGYITEAVKALIKVAFEINEILRVEIRMNEKNIDSRNVPLRIGLTHEGTLRDNDVNENNDHIRKMIWVIFKDEYEKSELRNQSIEAYDVIDRRIL